MIVRFALLFVVFLDIMSQGLVIPILITILLNPSEGFLPEGTAAAFRQFDYGLVMGVFFLAWFLGAAYISKLSDFIGRRQGILICLVGNLIGYVLTIVSLYVDSYGLLLIARAISGFTAGNQPIAQAALIDLSKDDEQKTQFMAYVFAAASFGFDIGPLLGGLLSDKALLGSLASNELPFYAISFLVIFNIVLILFAFREPNFIRRPVKVRPVEVFLTLYDAAQRPTVLKVSLVFFFGQIAFNAYYVFMGTFFFDRFGFGTTQNAIILIVFGVAAALTGTFFVAPVTKRYGKINVVIVSIALMALSALAALFNQSSFLAYVLIVPMVIGFATYYPTLLTLFSACVDPSRQGWVMGVSVALFTLGAGLISLIGGPLMAIDIRLPFIISVTSAVIALLLIFTLWRGADVRGLERG